MITLKNDMGQIANGLKKTILHPFSVTNEERLEYLQVLGLSWFFHLVHAFYAVFAVFIGLKTYQVFGNQDKISEIVYHNLNMSLQKFSIIFGISEAILYPVIFHFAYKFWKFLLNFYAEIFNVEESELDGNTDILNSIFISNVYLIIPVFGKLISFLAQGFSIFVGLKKKLKFTKLQAFLVLLTPLFIGFLFAVLIGAYFVFLFSMI